MVSTLKPHLLFEAADILVALSSKKYPFRYLNFKEPKAICDFALSSSHAYRMIAYLLKTALTNVSNLEDGSVRFGGHPLLFEMSSTHHIQALMRIAGRYCTMAYYTNECSPKADYFILNSSTAFHQPIFDGLSTNEVIPSSDAFRHELVMKAVGKGRQVHDVINIGSADMILPPHLSDVKGVIKKLRIGWIRCMKFPRCFEAWQGLKVEHIEFNNQCAPLIRHDVFRPYSPDMNYLKSLHMRERINVETVITMLKRYTSLRKLEFVDARFKPLKRLSLEEALKYVQKKTDVLWQAIVDHPAAMITVESSFHGYYHFDGSNVRDTVRRTMSDDFLMLPYHITYKLIRKTASKKLEVKLSL